MISYRRLLDGAEPPTVRSKGVIVYLAQCPPALQAVMSPAERQ
jgi:hypothetical protein